MFKNRFLSSAAFLLGPPGEGGDGGGGASDQDPAATGGAAAGDEGGAADDNDTGGAADDGSGAADDDGGDEGGAADDGEDELAGLTPEQRAKIEARIARETGWRDRQINKLYGKTRQLSQDVDALSTIADPQKRGAAQQQAAPDGGAKFTEEDVKREAQRLTAQERYDQSCNDADAQGRAVYGNNWGKRLEQLPKLGGIPRDDMEDVVATDKPHVVLFHLADPETYERVMSMPPAKRRTEFVKLSLLEEPRKARDIKEDVRPGQNKASGQQVQGRRTAAQQANLYDDKIEDDKWFEERNRTRRKKFSSVE